MSGSGVEMNCSSVLPGLTRNKQLVIVVPSLKQILSPCGAFEMLGHSHEVTGGVAPMIKNRSIKSLKTTKQRITKVENMNKRDIKGERRVHSNSHNKRRALRSCLRTSAERLVLVSLLFLVSAAAEASSGIQVREASETQVGQLQRQLTATRQQNIYEHRFLPPQAGALLPHPPNEPLRWL